MNEAFDYLLIGLSALANFFYLWRLSPYSAIKKWCSTIVLILLLLPIILPLIIIPEHLMLLNMPSFILWGFTAYYYSRTMPAIISIFSICMLILFYFTNIGIPGATIRTLLFQNTAFQDVFFYKYIWLAFIGLFLLSLSCLRPLMAKSTSALERYGVVYWVYAISACMLVPWSLCAIVMAKQRGLLSGAIVIIVWSVIQFVKHIRHAKDESITN